MSEIKLPSVGLFALIVAGFVIPLFPVGQLSAQYISLPTLEGPTIDEVAPNDLTVAGSIGDVDSLGVRLGGAISNRVRLFGELLGGDDLPLDADLSIGGGAQFALPSRNLPFESALRVKLHTTIDEPGDIWTFGTLFQVGDKFGSIPALDWFAGIGFDFINVDWPGTRDDDDDFEPTFMGGLNYRLGSTVSALAEISNAYDDTYLGLGLRFNFQ